MRALLELTKPGITRMVALTAAAGFVLAPSSPRGTFGILLLVHTLVGTALVTSGTSALNQWWERDADGRMPRTRGRPLPSGRLRAGVALAFAAALSALGIAYLAALVNAVTAALAALSLAIYVFVYTPLKRRTPFATLVGAVPGALPILGGWTAAGGAPGEPAAGALFGILFLWQIPHFLALGWLYREDYRAGGFAMLSRDDADGSRTGRLSVVYSLVLLLTSLIPASLGLVNARAIYAAGALLLGLVLLAASAGLLRAPTEPRARRLFGASILYLPALLTLLVVTSRRS